MPAGTATGQWAWLNDVANATPAKSKATGAWAFLDDQRAYDAEKNKTLPWYKPPVTKPTVAKPLKPTVVMDEAARQRAAAGLSLRGFASFDTDRGRNDMKGASVAGIGIRKPLVVGTMDKPIAGGLTTNDGLTAVGLKKRIPITTTGKPIGTVLK